MAMIYLNIVKIAECVNKLSDSAHMEISKMIICKDWRPSIDISQSIHIEGKEFVFALKSIPLTDRPPYDSVKTVLICSLSCSDVEYVKPIIVKPIKKIMDSICSEQSKKKMIRTFEMLLENVKNELPND